MGGATVRMNPRFPPFDKPKVRQAVAYATDYAAIGEAVATSLSNPRDRIGSCCAANGGGDPF